MSDDLKVSSNTDIAAKKAIQEAAEEESVIIDIGPGDPQIFTQEYLLCWIHEELKNRKAAHRHCGLLRFLIQGPWCQKFMPIWQSYTTALASHRSILSSLSEDREFVTRCRNFIYDLHSFTKSQSRNRLEGTGHEFYLGKPYFEHTQVDAVLKIEIMGGTVESNLRELARKKAATYDAMCASHDLAPIFELALIITWNSVSGRTEILHD
ncbi:hypothetical protein MMC18_001885 [Xylographa bjoerkii]|nr:hypothetical protein [Xylographa bjoerkii]